MDSCFFLLTWCQSVCVCVCEIVQVCVWVCDHIDVACFFLLSGRSSGIKRTASIVSFAWEEPDVYAHCSIKVLVVLTIQLHNVMTSVWNSCGWRGFKASCFTCRTELMHCDTVWFQFSIIDMLLNSQKGFGLVWNWFCVFSFLQWVCVCEDLFTTPRELKLGVKICANLKRGDIIDYGI